MTPMYDTKSTDVATQSKYHRLLLETRKKERRDRRRRAKILGGKLGKLQQKSEEMYKEQQRKTEKYLEGLKELVGVEDVEEEEDLYAAD